MGCCYESQKISLVLAVRALEFLFCLPRVGLSLIFGTRLCLWTRRRGRRSGCDEEEEEEEGEEKGSWPLLLCCFLPNASCVQCFEREFEKGSRGRAVPAGRGDWYQLAAASCKGGEQHSQQQQQEWKYSAEILMGSSAAVATQSMSTHDHVLARLHALPDAHPRAVGSRSVPADATPCHQSSGGVFYPTHDEGGAAATQISCRSDQLNISEFRPGGGAHTWRRNCAGCPRIMGQQHRSSTRRSCAV